MIERLRRRGSARSALVSATLESVLTALLGQAALVVSGVILARALGVEGRGLLALVFLVPSLLSQLGTLGMPLAATYFVARDPGRSWALGRSLLAPAVVQTLVLAAAQAVTLAVVFRGEGSAARTAAWASLAIMPALVTQHYALAFVQGSRRFRSFNGLRLFPVAGFAVAVAALAVVGEGALVPLTLAWIGVNLAAAILVAVAAVRFARSVREDGEPARRSEVARFGAKALLGTYSPADGLRLDQAVVGFFLSPAALGLYVVASAFTNLTRFISQSVGMVAYPTIASRRAPTEARRSLIRFAAVGLGLCAAVVLVLAATVGELLPFFFGSEFREAVPVARILLLGALLLAARRILTDGAQAVGQPMIGSAAELASWVALLPALVLLAPAYGVEGVAWAFVISAAVGLAAMLAAFLLPAGRAAAASSAVIRS